MSEITINLPVGTYVVAVSGGVDSMALLDLLAKHPGGSTYVVAHFDHGIRPDSAEDRALVEAAAAKYDLSFVYDEGRLGADASEATARDARYAFLRTVKETAGAKAIITAHHQDDVLETAVLNLLRGTNRRGLSSLTSTDEIRRPLLDYPKQALLEYANEQGLRWREDSTNTDTKYLRNYVRTIVLPKSTPVQRQQLLDIVRYMANVNEALDARLINYLHQQPAADHLDRYQFIMLPHAAAREVMAMWLRLQGVRGYDQKTLERLIVAAKTFAPNKIADVQRGYQVIITTKFLALKRFDR